MLYVDDIINICHGKLICGKKKTPCTNFTSDTRTLNPGDVYVGMKGETYDVNTFYKEAIKKGAAVCILDNYEVLDKNYGKAVIILVDNSIEAI